jgi:hypothetical protein
MWTWQRTVLFVKREGFLVHCSECWRLKMSSASMRLQTRCYWTGEEPHWKILWDMRLWQRCWRPVSSGMCCRVSGRTVVEAIWNVMAHAQKPDFVFRRNGRVHLNRQVRQFSRLLAAEVCALAVVMLVILDTACSEVVWRVLATHSIRQFPFHFPSRASPCVTIAFQLDSTLILAHRGNAIPLKMRIFAATACNTRLPAVHFEVSCLSFVCVFVWDKNQNRFNSLSFPAIHYNLSVSVSVYTSL